MDCVIDSGGLPLAAHLARPADAPAAPLPTLVLTHGFPSGPGEAAVAGRTYPLLADRLCAETGWSVLTFNFRGTGQSPGNFSIAGWLADLAAAVDHAAPDAAGVWLAGSRTGGSLAILHAASDTRVRGVVALGASATFSRWSSHPRRFLDHARQVGVITDAGYPPDPDTWGRPLTTLRPVDAIRRIAPRPVMLIHGTDDEVVPVSDARSLVAAAAAAAAQAAAPDPPAAEAAELHLLAGASHRLRNDPRTVAMLIGWMIRQAAV